MGQGQVEDILRNHRREGVHNAPLGHHPRGAALVVKQRDTGSPNAHLIQGIDEDLVYMQRVPSGRHLLELLSPNGAQRGAVLALLVIGGSDCDLIAFLL